MSIALGIAVHDITPPVGLRMGGYAARTGLARGTLDPLFCRAAIFRGGKRAAALVTVDLLYVREPWAAAVRRDVAAAIGGDPGAVLLAATHTHAGPAVFRSALVDDDDLREYERHVAEVIRAATTEAYGGLQPATLSFGRARVAGVAGNRQDQGREIDDSVRVLAMHSSSGDLIGAVCAFGCHPTVLAADNLDYSRDLFGAATDAVAGRTGASLLLCNGAAADVSTRFTRTAQTAAEVQRLGAKLADAIVDAVGSAESLEGGGIDARVQTVDVTARTFPAADVARGEVATAAARLRAARGRTSAGELRRLQSQLEGALAQLWLSENGGAEGLLGEVPRRTAVQVLRLGGCDVLAAPGEVFSSVGRSICAQRRRPAMLVGYANDYLGYLVPPGAAEGYEALMALVTPGSAERIAAELGRIGSERSG